MENNYTPGEAIHLLTYEFFDEDGQPVAVDDPDTYTKVEVYLKTRNGVYKRYTTETPLPTGFATLPAQSGTVAHHWPHTDPLSEVDTVQQVASDYYQVAVVYWTNPRDDKDVEIFERRMGRIGNNPNLTS